MDPDLLIRRAPKKVICPSSQSIFSEIMGGATLNLPLTLHSDAHTNSDLNTVIVPPILSSYSQTICAIIMWLIERCTCRAILCDCRIQGACEYGPFLNPITGGAPNFQQRRGGQDSLRSVTASILTDGK